MRFTQAITTLLATVSFAAAAPKAMPSDIKWFPTECDMYACGWCHWFYDKDTLWLREKKTTLPDNSTAEACLDPKTQRWVEPCTFCKNQPYCQGDCIPA